MYDALGERIKVFEGSVGELQPILGEVENLVAEFSVDDVVTNLENRINALGNAGKPITVALGG